MYIWEEKERDGGERLVYFQELAHEIKIVEVGDGKSQICRVGWRAGDPGRTGAAAQV